MPCNLPLHKRSYTQAVRVFADLGREQSRILVEAVAAMDITAVKWNGLVDSDVHYMINGLVVLRLLREILTSCLDATSRGYIHDGLERAAASLRLKRVEVAVRR